MVEKGQQMVEKGKKGILQVVFGRTTIILLLLLVQVGILVMATGLLQEYIVYAYWAFILSDRYHRDHYNQPGRKSRFQAGVDGSHNAGAGIRPSSLYLCGTAAGDTPYEPQAAGESPADAPVRGTESGNYKESQRAGSPGGQSRQTYTAGPEALPIRIPRPFIFPWERTSSLPWQRN